MIQRIQSIWLFIASVLAFLTLKFSFFSGTYNSGPNEPLNQYHQLNGTESIALMVTTIALGVLTLISIFLYKTRVVQFRLCIVAILLDLLLIFLYYKETLDFIRGEFAITAAAHPVIIVLLILAANGIRKDEKLIRDSDRLR